VIEGARQPLAPARTIRRWGHHGATAVAATVSRITEAAYRELMCITVQKSLQMLNRLAKY
jgi:hypothetical protein